MLVSLLTSLRSLPFDAQVAFFEALYERHVAPLLQQLDAKSEWMLWAPRSHFEFWKKLLTSSTDIVVQHSKGHRT